MTKIWTYTQALWRSPLTVGFLGLIISYLAVELLQLPVAFMALPILLMSAHMKRAHSKGISKEQERAQETANPHLSTIECLAKAIDAKDQETHGHIRRVQFYAVELGKRVGLSENELDGLRAAALLHDIGKLAVPESILNKPGKLTDREYSRMQLHTVAGAEILSQVKFPYPVVPAVLYHHERFDGQGYPEGLQGDQIPLLARILTLADFYDALRSERPYRQALTHDEVIKLIREERGRIFDPHLADVFCQHIVEFQELIAAEPSMLGVGQTRWLTSDQDVGLRRVQEPDAAHTATTDDLTHKDVFAIYKLAQNPGIHLDLEDTLSVVGNKLSRLIPATSCAIYLNGPELDQVEIRHVKGLHGDRLLGIRLRRDQGLTGWALTSRRMIANSDPSFDLQEALPDVKKIYQSATSFPLIENGQAFGAVTFYSARPEGLNEDYLHRLEIVMGPVSQAVAKSMSRERAEHHSLMDPIAGLPNREYLVQFAEEEIIWSRRHGLPVAVLAIDIDDFGRINTEHGFHIGDQVLRELGAQMASRLGPSATLSRMENDTFVALLPGFSPERAATAAQDIGAAVAAHGIHVRTGQEIRVRVSIGSAATPDDGFRFDELLARAEARLKSVQQTGDAGDSTLSDAGPRYRAAS